MAPPGVRQAPSAANGFDDRRQEVPPSAESYSSSYSSYYDRFYSKGPANGSAPQPPPQRPGAQMSGHGAPPVRGAAAVAAAAAARKQDQQTMLQTGPIYF